MEGSIPSSMRASADLVYDLTGSRSLEEFMEKVDSAKLAGADDLDRSVTDAHSFHQLGQMAVEIVSAYTYLNNVPTYRLAGALAGLGEDRTALAGDINLTTLASNPGRWSRVRERFNTWKHLYIREYRKLHRDFHIETSKIRERLSEMDQRLIALENIEQVEQIADVNHAPQLKSHLQSMQDALDNCDPGIETDDLEAMPHCTRCAFRVGDVPIHDIVSLEEQITDALDELIGTLRSDTIAKAMAGTESPIIEELRESLQGNDTAKVINVLKNKGNVDLLRGVLKGDGSSLVIVRDVSIVSELSKEYPTVSRESIQQVIDRFGALMEEALRTQQENVGPNVTVEMRLH